MSIGVVLEQLRTEFPDITVSKIRFLEAEGLVSPQRTASGYRRFTDEDIARLRYILITQRDNYLPLKVIRQQLTAMDSGEVTALLTASDANLMVGPENFRTPIAIRLSDAELAEKSGISVEFLVELLEAGLICPDAAGFFNNDDVAIINNIVALEGFGIDVRHLRAVRLAARRQADVISQVTKPVMQSRSPGAQARGEELGQQLSALMVSLHASLVKNELTKPKN